MKRQIEETIKQALRIGLYLTGKNKSEENTENSLREEDEKIVREVLSKQNIENKLEQYNRLNSNIEESWKQWQVTRNRHTRIIRYREIGIAATIALLFAIGSYWFYPENITPAPVHTAQIQAGSFKATLYTGDNKVIELKENMQAVLTQDSSVVVAHNELKHSAVTGAPTINTLVVPKGGEFSLVLADGTKIWLNADSRLKYPTSFSGTNREVELEGEAYFEVQHDDQIPFFVKAYPDDSFQKTTLETGSIGLFVDDKEFRLTPNEQAILNPSKDVEIVKVNARQQSVWRHGRFLFANERLEDIMAQLGRWYDVNIFFVGTRARELHFSGEIDRYEKIDKVLRMIELTTNISFSINGKTITITPE